MNRNRDGEAGALLVLMLVSIPLIYTVLYLADFALRWWKM